MYPYTGNNNKEKVLEESIKDKEQEISILRSSKIDAIRRSPSPKKSYISGIGFVDLNMDDVKRSEREINYIQSKMDEKDSEIRNLKEKLISIKTSYIPSYIPSNLQTELEIERIKAQQAIEKEKVERERKLAMIELERKIKERETEQILEMARIRAKYGASIETIESRLLKSKIEVESAQKSLKFRENFYEKELEDLEKTEKYLRDSLLNLWTTYGVKGLPMYEEQLENQKREVQIKKANYEAKLRELKLDPLWTPSFIKSTVKTPEEIELEVTFNLIKESETKIKLLEEKKLLEAYSSPRKMTLHMEIEDELSKIERLKNNLILGKSKWEIEQKLLEIKQKDILLKSEVLSPELILFKNDLDNFKAKCESIVTKISNSKESLGKSVYSPSHSTEYELDKKDLNNKNLEIEDLKKELATLKNRYTILGYPAFTSLYEFSKLESELKQREFEINFYLKEKQSLRESIEKIRKDELLAKSIPPPILSESNILPKSPYVSIYVNPDQLTSPPKEIPKVEPSLSPLQKYYEEKTKELKGLLESNDSKKLTEEAVRKQSEILDLRTKIAEKDKEIERFITLFYKIGDGF